MKFSYTIDSKQVLWHRFQITIEASSRDECDRLSLEAKNALHENRKDALPVCVTVDTNALIPDTRYILPIRENGGEPTVEISRWNPVEDEDSDAATLIYDNLHGLIKES